MRVVVVGGGIGGTATALAMLREGLDPLVIEQAPVLAEVGGGLVVAPNAMKALRYLGCTDRIHELGVRAEETRYFDLNTGAQIFSSRLGRPAAEVFGEYQHTMHRADLLDAIVSGLPAANVRLGVKVEDVTESADCVVVRLDSGETLEADLVVGADGIRSRVRAGLVGEVEPQFTGLLGWRALIPAADAPHIAPLPRVCLWTGTGRHVGFYPVRPDGLMNLFAWVPATEVTRESWTLSGDVDDLRNALAGACPELETVVSAVRNAFITPLYIRPPLGRWSTNRITLLGDAAHPATAAAGQGAAMALEDAVTLAACVNKHGAGDIPGALREYEARRIPRTSVIQAVSLGNLRMFNASDPQQKQARNGRFRGIQRLDPMGHSPWRALFGHDPVAAVLDTGDDGAGTEVTERAELDSIEASIRSAFSYADRGDLWMGERAGYERLFRRVAPPPTDTVIDTVTAGGVPSLLVGDGDGPLVLHLHGGTFCMGSATSSVGLAARLAREVGGQCLVPDYRLAPEHPYPAALFDALDSYRWLLGCRRGPVIVTGEDAGACLALGLAMSLRDGTDEAPAAMHLFSPIADLTLSSPSIDTAADPWYGRDRLITLIGGYLHDHDPLNPLVSPLHGDLSGLPPMRVWVAENEALYDDAVRLVDKARADGVHARLHSVADSVHSYVLYPTLAEAQQAIKEVAELALVRAR